MRGSTFIGWGLAGMIALMSPLARADNVKVQCIKANTEAQSLRREGKLAESREQLKLCIAQKCPSLVRADCVKRLDELESVQPTVVFSVVDGQGRDLSDVKVVMDGRPFLERLQGVAVDADLGEHELTFIANGHAPVTQRIVFREGEKARLVRVVISDDGDERGEAAADPRKSASPPEVATEPGSDTIVTVTPREHSPRSSRRTAGYIVGGVGLAGLAIGGVFGYLTLRNKSEQIDNCGSELSCADYAKATKAHEDAKSNGLVSTVAFVAGAAATGLGLVLVLSGRPSSRDTAASTTLQLSPAFGRNEAGLWISGDL